MSSGELVVIAVMSALAVLGRSMFFMLPSVKPMSAIVILTGIGFGIEAGFLTGTVVAFVSNFFFGQGPWTPWQMFTYGILGIIGGFLGEKLSIERKNQKKEPWRQQEKQRRREKWIVVLVGSLSVMLIYGGIMDAASVLMTYSKWNAGMFLAAASAGLPVNLIHGGSTAFFLFFLEEPFRKKMERIKKKYGYFQREKI